MEIYLQIFPKVFVQRSLSHENFYGFVVITVLNISSARFCYCFTSIADLPDLFKIESQKPQYLLQSILQAPTAQKMKFSIKGFFGFVHIY